MKNPFIHEAHRVERFADQSVVDRYHLRPTYSPETFTILAVAAKRSSLPLDSGGQRS